MDKPLARSRVPDVARAAGVSTATVDRVLHGRAGVRAVTVERVVRAAAALGYILDSGPYIAKTRRPQRLVFLLPEGSNRFLAMLGQLVAETRARFEAFGFTARVEFIRSFNPALLARALRDAGREAEGVAFMALEHPAVREAVDALAEAGIPTVTLISDIANTRRAAYVGLDNRSTGRTAGYMMARFIGPRPAKVAMIAGSLSYRAHEEREMGFLHLFAELFPAVEVLGVREGHDDEAENYRQAKALLARHPDLAGLYNIGGASAGIARALREARKEQEIVFIGHGLTSDTRALLIDGTMDVVITQNPRALLMDCAAIFDNLRAGLPTEQNVGRPVGEILLRENLP
ncbi:LacI family DNA-binding transcriptional regulator [Roseomonas haemaphysalidis]|uniref:LacI family DNA-binding transcriptional regulator n=1 Tax=Roseomonas haemaphysalidis TaxID=2768162 RepID=A0ABS3KKQ9_9PROT|nr:LacI family DNA-binding transcriptional regulator [Roseomonas haemaphysalidis]MBO1078041.1 LacI family DNA-binding transcriptional regulator [Roseomonas haemaphysalidis]